MSIHISEGGPYIVSGNIPLLEKEIAHGDEGYFWRTAREIPHPEKYALCRCGRSKNAPFCDGTAHRWFRGKERADRRPFSERCDVLEGPGITLEDDRRCSMSRFCHRSMGTPWRLLDRSDDPAVREEIVKGSLGCPSGRIVLKDADGKEIRSESEPAVWIVQDPGKGVSGGIFVMGGIPLIGSDGFAYDVGDRYMLCRCGASGDMPFCDASHINRMFKDDRRNEITLWKEARRATCRPSSSGGLRSS